MAEQPIKKAFSFLNLSIDASEGDIKKSYRLLAKKYHPDKSEGNNTLWVNLKHSYGIASAYAKIKNSVIPLSGSQSLEQINQSLMAQQASFKASETARIIKGHKVRPLEKIKPIVWAICGFSGFLALFGKNILPIFPEENKLIFGFVTFIFGTIALILQWSITSLQNKIDSYLDAISNHKYCASELAKVLKYEDRDVVSENDVMNPDNEEEDVELLLTFPIFFGQSSLTKTERRTLLLNKSIEHGLLNIINQEHDIKPDSVFMYHLQFKPSDFKQEPKTEPNPIEPKIKTLKEVLINIGAFLSY